MQVLRPKFTIVIPLYNKELYIKRAIKSVLNQTFEDFELIVVNDGSTDLSLQKVRSLDCEKLMIIDKVNGGESSARNEGIKKARGEFICFLDGDDEYLENHLSILKYWIDLYPNIDFFSTNSYDSFGKDKALTPAFPIDNNAYEIENYFDDCKYRSVVSSNTACIRRNLLLSLELFDENLVFGPDLEMWFRLAINNKLVFIPVPTAIYHREADNRIMDDQIKFNHNFIKKLIRVSKNKDFENTVGIYIETKIILEYKRILRQGLNSKARQNIRIYKKNFRSNTKYYINYLISFLPFNQLSKYWHNFKDKTLFIF